jgi:crossover junction endodeoxyribonuclease RuvC
MKFFVTVGIDPGTTGAAALLIDGQFQEILDFDSGDSAGTVFQTWVTLYNIDMVFLEKVHGGAFGGSARKPGGKSMFNFGKAFGWWVGALDYSGVPYRLIQPRRWMAGLVPPKKDRNDKPGLPVARALFPKAPLSLKKHHNRADACLLAWRAYEMLKEG